MFHDLEEALGRAEYARRCISENRGPDKELAQESYEAAVSEDLQPILVQALDSLTPRQVESLARRVVNMGAKL